MQKASGRAQGARLSQCVTAEEQSSPQKYCAQGLSVLQNNKIHQNHHAGFSLTELLVVIVMVGILSTAAYKLFREQSRINITQQNFVEMQSNARAAMQAIIKDFSHAGFGCADSFSSGSSINGNATFLIPSNNPFSASAPTPDRLTLVYGYQHVGTITQDANATNSLKANTTGIATTQTDQFRRHISFFPYTDPNSFFIGTGSNGNNITLTLNRDIESIRSGAKIFRVTQIEYFVDANTRELRIRPVLSPADVDTLIYDVQDFQLAYSTDGTTWTESPTLNETRNVKIIWTYLLLRSREREPGYQESKNFILPWNNAQIQGANLPAGFHYYEMHSQIWLRNVL